MTFQLRQHLALNLSQVRRISSASVGLNVPATNKLWFLRRLGTGYQSKSSTDVAALKEYLVYRKIKDVKPEITFD